MVKDHKMDPEALIEIFGTPHPNEVTVLRWKRSWRDTRGRIEVKSYAAALNILNDSGIDPLFYQMTAESGDGARWGEGDKYYITFYKDEHEVFFKLHAGMA